MKLWTNGFIHTLETKDEIFFEMITDQGKIVGFDSSIFSHFDEVIDLNKAHVYPGFVDAHLHILGYGEKLTQIDLSDTFDKSACLFKIKENLTKNVSIFYGLKDIKITKEDLNLISNVTPIIIKHYDYHAYTCNDVVLKHASIESSDGVIDEIGILKVNQIYLNYSNDSLKEMISGAIKNLWSYGITGGHSDDLYYYNGFKGTYSAFEDISRNLKFRTHLLIHHEVLDDYLLSKKAWLNQNPFLQLGAVKIFYDGTLSSQTALIHGHYLNSKTNGKKIQTDESFEELILKIRSNGLTAAIHVIGDSALENVILILKKHPPKKGLHDRIIHASLVSKKALLLMKDMPIIIDIQPQFIYSDLPKLYQTIDYKPDYVYPFKTMYDQKNILCGSSDAPVEIPNPMYGIYELVTRQTGDLAYLEDGESLPIYDALKLYTTYANVPTYELYRGMIKKGFIADFTVFDQDLLSLNVEEIKEIKPIMTIVDETIVYKK